MAWPTEAGSLPQPRPRRRRRGRRRSTRTVLVDPSPWRERFTVEVRGVYRVMNAAELRFYRDNSAPPEEGDTPFATASSLPDEPTDTFADGTWYLAASRFNGCIDSGFYPTGPRGETYERLDLSGGAAVDSPPAGPDEVRLELRAGGVVRVVAIYSDASAQRADTWAIGYTTNGVDPVEDSPTATETIPANGSAVLSYDIPAQAHGTTVKVRLQTLKGSTYSDGSTVLSATADATGPSAPGSAEAWSGQLPEDL